MNGPLHILVSAAVLFLQIVTWMTYAHVVISWVSRLGIYLYVRPLEVAARSLYAAVRKVVPTQVGGLDFAPAIVIVAAQALVSLLNPLA